MVPKPKTEEAIMGDQIEMVVWFVSYIMLGMGMDIGDRGLRSLSMPSRIAQ